MIVSAGVGRSGAFIALDSLLDQANADSVVDVYAFTCAMRKNRANMIQTVVSSQAAHFFRMVPVPALNSRLALKRPLILKTRKSR